MRHVQVDARKHGDEAQTKAEIKANQVYVLQSHNFFPFPFRADGLDSGLSTSSSRSARPGFSMIAASSARHERESSCLATVTSAWWSTGSLRKRSAPLMSQRSSLSS